MKQAKIGFFGGSFDPIHLGHLQLAKELSLIHHLDEVWFCPASLSPYKIEQPSAPIVHRMKMIELAIENEPSFSVLDLEARRKGISYTIDTLRILLQQEELSAKNRQIYLILSDETAASFHAWKNAEELVEKVPLLIGSRFQTNPSFAEMEDHPKILGAIKQGWTKTKKFPISSSEIRQRLKLGLNCQKFLSEKVLDYILENHLYF